MYSVSTPLKSVKPQNVTKKTLDVQHNLKLKNFQEKESQVSELYEELNMLQNNLAELTEEQDQCQDTNEPLARKIVDIQDKILALKKSIQFIEKDFDEVDYLVNTADILFKYYDIIDKGSPQQEEAILPGRKSKAAENGILKYLAKKDSPPVTPPDGDVQNGQAAKASPQAPTKDKASLLEKYLAFTENNYVKPMEDEVSENCPYCNSCVRNVMLNDGLIYCNSCFTVEYLIVDHDRPSYKDPPKEVTYFSYKRINHYNEFSGLSFNESLFSLISIMKNLKCLNLLKSIQQFNTQWKIILKLLVKSI
jgi:hypothetical protein